MLQIDSAREAADLEVAQQQAAAIAVDNADGLGEERRKAVLAEAEAATAGLLHQRALPHPPRVTRGFMPHLHFRCHPNRISSRPKGLLGCAGLFSNGFHA